MSVAFAIPPMARWLKPGGSDFWTPEREAALREHFDAGDSFAMIALKIGGGCTRNQALGKAHRLGLPKRTRTRATTRINQRIRFGPPRVRLVVNNDLPPTEAPGLATLLTLTSDTCRWPIGDPLSDGFTFCGQRRAPGRPYCVACLDRHTPYVTASQGERDLEKVLRRIFK